MIIPMARKKYQTPHHIMEKTKNTKAIGQVHT